MRPTSRIALPSATWDIRFRWARRGRPVQAERRRVRVACLSVRSRARGSPNSAR